MKVYPDVDFYILIPEITGKSSPKASKKRRKQQLTENQKTTEYGNVKKMGTRFLHLSCQGEGSHP